MKAKRKGIKYMESYTMFMDCLTQYKGLIYLNTAIN